MRDSVDPAVPLAADERVVWVGCPRKTVVLPSVLTGAVLVIAGLLAGRQLGTVPAGVLVLIGAATPVWRYAVNRNTQYVVSEEALYVKRGVVSRSVSQAWLSTVQNSSYTQGLTGTLFGYGSVEFEVAGGADLTFSAIDDPGDVRSLVDRETRTGDGLTSEGGPESGVPGSLEQWQRIREEVRALHRALD
jgi:uncharacterized membrane protein YdbT with pleckstrin-like domain